MATWRERARPIITEVIKANQGADEETIRKALKDAYPWGPRAMHPYKIWLDECNAQLAGRKIENNDQAKLF